MADQREYDSLVRQRADAEQQYRQHQRRMEEYEYRLNRLRPVYREVREQKRAFHTIKDEDQDIRKDRRSWEGQQYDRFKSKCASMCDEDDRYYVRSLDYVLDALNDEITRIENLRLQEFGILGRLGSWINTLANKIENFFN